MSDEQTTPEKPADLHDPGRYSKPDGDGGGGEPGGYTDLEGEAQRRSDAAGTAPETGQVVGVSEANTSGDESDDYYDSKTVQELHDIAKERGIAYSGVKKADLVAALHEDDDAD